MYMHAGRECILFYIDLEEARVEELKDALDDSALCHIA